MSETRSSTVPFLRWAGSKRQVVSILSSYWQPSHKRYIEPFLGSACLFFFLRPEAAVLSDVNKHLMATYHQVKSNAATLQALLGQMRNGKDEYYSIREKNSEDLSSAEMAARFIYLNRFSFNGLYRTNKQGKFNVPYGGERSGGIPPANVFDACSHALKRAKLATGDFSETLKLAKPGDFVYMDPPYSVSARRVFNEYTPTVFSDSDLDRLMTWMAKLTETGVEFLVSYADSEEAHELARGYSVDTMKVRRNISGFVGSRKTAEELLISNKNKITTAESNHD